jgi:hypothetical protein
MRATADGFVGLASGRFAIAAPFLGRRIGPSAATETAVPNIPRVRSLSIGAGVRHPPAIAADDIGSFATAQRQSLFNAQRWATGIASDRTPADWRLWVEKTLEVEDDVNGGTAGTTADDVFERAFTFMTRHDAPPEAWAAIRFRHCLATWNFEECLEASDRLIPLARKQVHWMHPDELRLGATVARLLQRDPKGARDALDQLAGVSTMQPDDVRARLLRALIARSEQPGGGLPQVHAAVSR